MKHFLLLLLSIGILCSCVEKKNKQSEPDTQNAPVEGVTPLSGKPLLVSGNIQHTVQFNLKYDADAPESKQFVEDGRRILSALPMVRDFEALRQVGAKNEYKFYFTMIFDDMKAYDEYNNHPDHVKFVKERWQTEVADFLEADFVVFE